MNKEDLLFYDEYENFYAMAEQSKAFKNFCKDAFGEDLSQDGFSDLNQVNMILPYINNGMSTCVLDIGCGNGKMLKYLKSMTNCGIYGFDYSKNAIETAKSYLGAEADFKEGVIGEIEYPKDFFDVIVSMDTMYFAKDMKAFVGQINDWLKMNGIFFAAYQEGDIMPKTLNANTTVLADAFRANKWNYSVTDITKQTHEMLFKKRQAAISHKEEFLTEGSKEWFDMLMWQTECVLDGYEKFSLNMSRYIYVAKKTV